MRSVYAVQVRTGFESKAKEMLKHVLLNANEKLVKGIYALETYTAFISNKTNSVDTDYSVTEEDISNHLRKGFYQSEISNLRMQLEIIEPYNTPEYDDIKKGYREEVNRLERKVEQIRSATKTIHSVMPGYILVELKNNATYLPDRIWHLIKSVPFVNRILSTAPIPEHEMQSFISNLDKILEPEVEIEFGKEVDHEEVREVQSEILEEINSKEISKEDEQSLLEKIDQIQFSVVEKAKEIIANKPSNPFFRKIKAFVKRKKEVVSLPLSYLAELYTETELRFIGKRIEAKDFLLRLNNHAAMAVKS